MNHQNSKQVFEKSSIRNMVLDNRIAVAPMCTYMCKKKDGVSTEFHLAHYTTLALGKPAFIIQEATSVDENGYIDDFCLGIFTPRQRESLKKVVDSVHSLQVKIGIQLNHAGAKARHTKSKIYAPSKLQDDEIEMTKEDIDKVIRSFEYAAKYSRDLGYDFVEIHAAHGYLINQFLSPLKNKREDEYGIDKTLFLKQIIDVTRKEFDGPIGVRISAEEYADGGNHIQESVLLAKELEKWGIDVINVSTGGVVSYPIETYPLYQVPQAEAIKKAVAIPVMCAGLITKPHEIESIIQNEQADYVLLGRELIRNPFFILKWMFELGIVQEKDLPEYLFRALKTV